MCADRRGLFRRLRRDRRGASALEFALVSPVFIAMLLGIFELGWAYHCATSVQYALERASRQLMINGATTTAQIKAQMDPLLTSFMGGTYTLSMSNTTVSGVTVRVVTAVYSHQLLVPLVTTANITFTARTAVPVS